MINHPTHIKDVGGYIYFSDKTRGLSGKPVKIHTSLFLDFFCALDITTQEGQAVIRDIENLKVNPSAFAKSPPIALPKPRTAESPGHVDRMAQVRKNAADMSHQLKIQKETFLVTKNFRVYYHIHQKEEDSTPTVYISELQVIHRGQDSVGGLYQEKSANGDLVLSKSAKADLDGKTVFLSGATSSVEAAMEDAKYATGNHSVALFFCPMAVADDLGVWKTNRLTEQTKNLAKELEDTIRNNQTKTVNWLVEAEGAGLLSVAIEKISGSLEKHSFKFNNAKANLPKLLGDLSQHKAQLTGEFIGYQANKAALLTIVSQKDALIKQISSLGAATGYNSITRRYLTQQIASLGGQAAAKLAAQPQNLRGSSTTFLGALIAAGAQSK
ncbi:MAG TPA: hypothetical protein VIZ65_11880 [Cellvibrionaceae bacterium]